MAQTSSEEKNSGSGSSAAASVTPKSFCVPPCLEDKIWGGQSKIYLQWYLYCLGYNDVNVDGDFGKCTISALQKLVNATLTDGGQALDVNGKFDKATITGFQKYLQLKLDEYQSESSGGKFRYISKVTVDGKWGDYSIRALQRVLNVEFQKLNADGKILFSLVNEDGAYNVRTQVGVELFLLSQGYNIGQINSKFDKIHVQSFQMYINDSMDNNNSMSTIVDGDWGSPSIQSLCSLLGIKSSQSMNKTTVESLQKYLNDYFGKINGIPKSIDDKIASKIERFKNLDFYCLDNSLRESTVGQVAAHTLDNKKAIYEQVKLCGLKDMVVASFNAMTRVDDDFVKWLKETEDSETFNRFVSFSEITTGVTYDEDTGDSTMKYNTSDEEGDLPDGMKKNKLYGLINTFFEADFADDANIDWDNQWTVDDECKLLEKRIRWVKDNISKDGKNLLNMRDFPTVMNLHPDRMLSIVKFLAEMPEDYRLFGLCFEDPMGEYLPDQLGKWTKQVRDTMSKYGWKDGKLLNHIHGKWGYKDASTMECLANGSDGMWASLCEEGAAVGHSSTTVVMMNLVRHGNTIVQEKYDGFLNIRNAAIEVTKLTTTKMPHPKQVIYGERATDLVFGFLGIGDFDVAAFFGYEAPNRITPLATATMIVDKLIEYFGNDNGEQFNETTAEKMREQMQDDLRNGVKNEYDSEYGLSMLFQRAGGKLTEKMGEALKKVESHNELHQHIKNDIKKLWDSYAQDDGKLTLCKKRRKKRNKKNKKKNKNKKGKNKNKNKGKNKKNKNKNKNNKDNKNDDGDSDDDSDDDDNCSILSFDRFYHGFMQPFFGCYRCQVTKKALKCIDFDEDDVVDWDEFAIYIDWALHQYDDEIADASECITIAFEKGIIPAMRDDMATNIDGYQINPENFSNHTASVIFLHGIADFDEIGKNGDYWFGKFNAYNVSKKFEHIRFVFPDANELGITKADGKSYQAWFDVNPNKDEVKSDEESTTSSSSSGTLDDVMKGIKKMIRKEIRKYRISSNRIILCGYNQGSMVALKAGLEMNKEFGGVICYSGLLEDGENSSFDQLFNSKKLNDKNKKEMGIYWFDNKYSRMYDHLNDDYSKKCFDYLKNDCKLNAFYQKTDNLDKVFECIDKQLPAKFDE